MPNHGRNLGHTKQEAPADADKDRADAVAAACEQAEFRRWLNEQTADTSGDRTAGALRLFDPEALDKAQHKEC